jgi:DNA-binding transcriptional MerR regulator
MAVMERRELIDTSEAARRLNLTTQRLSQLVRLGVLMPAWQSPKGWRLFDPEAITQLGREREQARSQRLNGPADGSAA